MFAAAPFKLARLDKLHRLEWATLGEVRNLAGTISLTYSEGSSDWF
jgi:hypothetical protein